MKKVRVLISASLVILMCAAWFGQIQNGIGRDTDFNSYVKQGDAWTGQGLYQKAISSYQEALKIKLDYGIEEKMLRTFDLAVKDGCVSSSEYINAMQDACNSFPKETALWEKLMETQIESEAYNNAYSTVKKLASAKVTSKRLEELENKVLYSFLNKSAVFEEVFGTAEGRFTLCKNGKWGAANAEGRIVIDCEYDYISPFNSYGTAVYVNSQDSRLIDRTGVVQNISDEIFSRMRAYGDGLIPTEIGNGWRYYSFENGYVLGIYENASSFTDKTAAVKENGKWHLIDINGSVKSDAEFDEIVLNENGTCLTDGIIIASQNGKFGIFDKNGKLIAKTDATEMDMYLGDYIAFTDSGGLWGYMDKKGNVMIDPQFKEAKSFSGGLGAVSNGEKWGFVNNIGEVVIDYQFAGATYFNNNGICFVDAEDSQYHMISLRFPGGVK